MRRVVLVCLFIALCLIGVQTVALAGDVLGGDVYVSVSGNDGSGDGSLAKPYATVQKGIDMAAVGDTVAVGPGEFKGDITLHDGVSVIGAGALETTLAGSGNLDVPVVTADGIGVSATLSGFTIAGGAGGGIYCVNGSALTVTDNEIENNTAIGGGGISCYGSSPVIVSNLISDNHARYGGGIYCSGSSPTVSGNVISSNDATVGGGLYCVSGSSPVITDNGIRFNGAERGAGIHCSGSSPSITKNTIEDNVTTLGGDGGGISCSTSSPAIEDNKILRNTALSGSGGGIYCYDHSAPSVRDNAITGNQAGLGGAVCCESSSAALLFGNDVFENQADYGGGLYCVSSSPTVTANTIAENTATSGSGGGVYCSASSPVLTNDVISGNKAPSGSGGAVSCAASSSPTLVNDTLVANSADSGGGVACSDAGSVPRIANCIVWDNGDDLSYCWAEFSDISNPTAAGGSGNTTLAPSFVATSSGDYRLNAGSPCIDSADASGAPAADIDGVPRPQGSAWDMGAYEFSAFTLAYQPGNGGTLSGTTTQTVSWASGGTTVTAVPGAHYDFAAWSDGVKTSARRDTSITANLSVTALFASQKVTATYTAGSNGSLEGSATQAVDYGTSCTTVTAAPADHYHFVSWSDAVLTAARRDTSLTANVSVTASFTINTFALHYNDGPGGTLSGITSQTVDYGSSGTTVTAEHADHYHFVSWSDGVKTAIRRETSVSEDTSVTAAFAIDRFTVAYVSAGHGSIDGSLTQTMDYGSSGTTVTAVASPHYLFASWSDGVTSLSRRATSVSADSTLTATFLPVDTFTLRYLAGPGGKLQGTAYQTVGYDADGTTVTAEPDAHYQFVTWSDGVKTAARCEVAVTADSSVTASFALDTYHLAYAAGTGGSITGDTSQTVAYGSNGTTVTAVPAQYHYFVGWSDGVLTPARRETSVGAGVSATAEFAAYRVHLAYAAGTYGSVSGVTSQTVDQGSNGTTVTATPDVHAQFVSWSDGVLTAARRDIGVTSDVAVTAAFALDTFHLAYTAGAGGTISGVASQTVTYGASATTVTALPDAHYQFVSWSDGVKTAERCDKNVSGAVAATASFAIDTYHVAYTAGTGGTISGVASQTVAYGASATTVTAVPAAHRHFVSWSDGVKTAARRDKNVSGPLAFTASFAIDTYRLAYTAGAGGTLSGVTSQTVVYGSSGSLVTAVAGSGYRFTSWSDGVTTAARTDRSVAANIAVTARFSRVKTAVVVTGPMIKTGAILPANTWLKTSGYLTPRHAAGSQTVILTTAVYRLGRWSAGPRIVTTNSDYQTYSKWTSSRFAFYIKGQWRMQATSPADADHLAAVGPLVFFTVK